MTETGPGPGGLSEADQARAESARLLAGLGTGSGTPAEVPSVEAPEPVVAPEPPYDERLKALVSKDLAWDLAHSTKPMTDVAATRMEEAAELYATANTRRAELKAEAATLAAEAKTSVNKAKAAALRRQAAAKEKSAADVFQEIDDKVAQAEKLKSDENELANDYLKSKEEKFVPDVNEARERAEREDRLQTAKAEAIGLADAARLEAGKLAQKESLDAVEKAKKASLEAEKQSRIDQAEAFLKKANEVGDERGAEYRAEQEAIKAALEARRVKVNDAVTKGIVDVDEMLAVGVGSWKVDLSKVDQQDQLKAARDVEDLLGRSEKPELELKSDHGRVRELFYQSDKKGSSGRREPLVIVERWDNVTGKLISLNTLVSERAIRVGWTAKFWKGEQILPSREVEKQMKTLRIEDEAWKHLDGNSTPNRDPDALGLAMAYMRVPEAAEWQGKPPKKVAKKHWWSPAPRTPKPRS